MLLGVGRVNFDFYGFGVSIWAAAIMLLVLTRRCGLLSFCRIDSDAFYFAVLILSATLLSY